MATPRNIQLTIEYDGTRYAGWQFQENARSVQETIEKALDSLIAGRPRLFASGRTDAGVHAKGQVANFKTRSPIPLDNLRMGLNSRLPRDIRISAVKEVPATFNAQHDARYKSYRYTIALGDWADPFMRNFAAHSRYKLDIDAMKREARVLLGRHDLKSFRSGAEGGDDTVRTIRKIRITRSGEFLYIDMEADGFLYNMARNIAGTLMEIGRGKMPPGSMKKILLKRERKYCGPTAPARGLRLERVRY